MNRRRHISKASLRQIHQDIAEVAFTLHKGADELTKVVQQSADHMKSTMDPLVEMPKPLLKEANPQHLSQLKETFSQTYLSIFNASAAFLRYQIESLRAAGESNTPPPLDKNVTPTIFKSVCKSMCQSIKDMIFRARTLGSEISDGAKVQIQRIRDFFNGSSASSTDSSDSSDSSGSKDSTTVPPSQSESIQEVLKGYELLIQTFGVYLDLYRDMHETTLRFASLCVVFVVGVPRWSAAAIEALKQSSTKVLDSMTSSAVCCLSMSNASHAVAMAMDA